MSDGTKPKVAELVETLEAGLKEMQACVDLLKKIAVKPRGRPRRYGDNGTIRRCVRDNPYPLKSGKRHQVFELLGDGVLVGDFRRRAVEAGLVEDGWGYLRYNVRKGYIEVR
jgi:hypothetical protein